MSDLINFSVNEIGSHVVVLLIVSAVVAGYIDTLVGGGGLITIPALLAAGVPPIQALGTNKLQASAGTGTASITLILKKKIEIRYVCLAMVMAFIGALFGALIIQRINAELLELIIPLIIVLILAYFLLAPAQKTEGSEPKISAKTHRLTAVPLIGLYDGMFGPATGSFFVLAGVSLRGQGIVHASVVAKTLNFATNLAALMVFVWFGQVAFFIGFVMMLGQFVGASLGARALMKIDPAKLRGLVVAMSLIMLVAWFVNK